MGSANGTKVNGAPADSAKPLKSGDTISVGPVVFGFDVQEITADPTMPPTDQSTRIVGIGAASAAPVDDGSTKIKSSSAILPPVAKGQSGARKRPDIARPNLEVEGTAALPDDGTMPPRNRPPSAGAGNVAVVPAKSTGARAAVRASGGNGASGMARTGAETGPNPVGSAADRLRRRRQYGDTLGGQLAFLWDGLTRGTRAGILLGGAVTTLGIAAGLFFLFKAPDDGKELPTEPATLGRTAVPFSFGYGDDVDYQRLDLKTFEFEFAAATRAVAVLRYQASNVSGEEVAIAVNGAEQGRVPPDTSDRDREIQTLLSPRDLKKGETNRIVFDNTRNPPGKETWSVSNISVEVIPIPDGSDEELTTIASDYSKKAKEYWDNRDIGAENIFRSWKNFRAAWLTLEALKGPKPEIYRYIVDQLESTSRELDLVCRKMMLDVQRNLVLKQEGKAASRLIEVDAYFPTPEHRCHNQAHALRQKLEL